MEEKEDFSDKYINRGQGTKLLLSNFFRTLGKLVEPVSVESALEVGCGPGFSTQHLSTFFPKGGLKASEYREDLVREASARNPGIPIIEESIYELQRQDNSFDLIFALEVFEHLEKPEDALAELHRVTKKYCLISVPNEPIWRILNMCRLAYVKDFGNTPGHIQHWNPLSFRRFVGQRFHIVATRLPLPWTIVLGEKK